MLKIGLTGGIGSGKSTVSKIIREKGIKVIDADIIAREVINIYPVIKEEIKKEFGEEFFYVNGNLKRRELGNYVFKCEDRRKKLEHIIMPYIKLEIDLRFKVYEYGGEKLCVLDAPTLFEQGIHRDMHKNILVWVDKKTQIDRVRNRDFLSEEEVLNRINAQMSMDEKKKYADFIIDNSKNVLTTEEQVSKILTLIEENEGWQ